MAARKHCSLPSGELLRACKIHRIMHILLGSAGVKAVPVDRTAMTKCTLLLREANAYTEECCLISIQHICHAHFGAAKVQSPGVYTAAV